MTDRIAKRPLHVILLVDCSTSMRGERIAQVNRALRDVKKHLADMQSENVNVDFFLTVITFSTEARLLNNDRCRAVDRFSFTDIRAGGWSNLHLAYVELADLLKKQRQGGIMPDFGGVAPILLLLTDGHPTKYPIRDELEALRALPWFRAALKYGIAIGLDDDRTMKTLRDFVDGNGDVVSCYDAGILGRIIRIIVLTASKVSSQSSNIRNEKDVSVVARVDQEIRYALGEEDWEW